MKRVPRIVLSIFLSFASFLIIPVDPVVAVESQAPPTVCQDKVGQVKPGEIDVLVLMDNSGSLEGENATDAQGLRFDALDEFVDNFAGLSSEGKNFSLVKFSTTAEIVVDFQPISSRVTEGIKKEIRDSLGEAAGRTDYRQAFEISTRLLQNRPAENCKILIWFTDGGFNTQAPGEQDEPSKVEQDLTGLESSFCSEDGYARIIQENDINTFVVFLGNGLGASGSADQKRIDASIDVMQVITGDEVPSIQDGKPRTVSGGKCAERVDEGVRHLGEVVSANEASDLLGYLTDIANIADGGKPAIAGDCPIDTDDIESVPLPSGYLIDWVSVTSWDGTKAIQFLEKLNVTIGSEDFEIDDLFATTSASSESNIVRFEVQVGKEELLRSGWKLRATDLGRVCIRVKPRDLKFRLSGGKLTPVTPELPSSLYEGRTRLTIGGDEVSLSEAASRSAEGITGRLQVENGQVFSPDGTLPVSIEVSELPILLSERCRIEIVGSREASDEMLTSTTCSVFPAPAVSVTLDAANLFAEISSCGLGEWHTTVNGERNDTIEAGTEPVEIGIESDSVIPNQNTKCELGPQFITLTAASSLGSTTGMPSIDVVVDFEIVKRANPWIAILLASLATAIVSLISLVLLRLVNDWTSKTVRAQDFFGYETDLELGLSQSGRGELRISGQNVRAFVADIDQLQTVSGNKKQTSLSFGKVKLNRELPRFARPFEESRLVLVSKAPSVFWKANRSSDGLQMAFPRAIILTSLEDVAPTNERTIKARASVLVPKRGFGSGVEGVEQMLRERGDDLATELVGRLKANTSSGMASEVSKAPPTSGDVPSSPSGSSQRTESKPPQPQRLINPPLPGSTGSATPGSNRPGSPPEPPKRTS